MPLKPLSAALLCGLLVALPAADAAVRMPGIFGDGMVLQTNTEYGARAFLYGLADPGEKVTVLEGTRSLFPPTPSPALSAGRKACVCVCVCGCGPG